jgi:hypothetical protein
VYGGILCDLCGSRVPGVTVNATLKVTRGSTVHISRAEGLEVCAVCLFGTVESKSGVTYEVMRVTEAEAHRNPLES